MPSRRFVAAWMFPLAVNALRVSLASQVRVRGLLPLRNLVVCACRGSGARIYGLPATRLSKRHETPAAASAFTFGTTSGASQRDGASSWVSDYIARRPLGPYALGARGLSLASGAHVRPVTLPLTDEEKRLFRLLLRVVEEERLGTTLRVAGGWVRDKLLLDANGRAGVVDGATHKVDIDIALDNCLGREFAEKINSYLSWRLYKTRHPSRAVSRSFLRRMGRKSHAVGLVSKNPDKSKHLETATMQLGGFWVDFVNLRTESYTLDSRIPNMGIGTPEEDAFRRDLTINSLFYNINTGCVEDFTGRGACDLSAGLISTPLPAATTLLDDPLRVLRSVRFASRFRFRMAEDLLRACMDPNVHEALGKKVSRERIGAEVDLMVRSREPLRAFELLCQLGLATLVFPLPDTAAVHRGGSSSAQDGRAEAAVAGGGATDPSPVFAQSLVYLKNMHYLLRDGAVAHATGLTPEHASRADQRRLALYAAFLLPFADSTYSEGKRKGLPLVRYLLADMLKMRARDADTVHLLHTCALDFQLLLRRSVPGPLTEAAATNFAVDRLEAGLLVRRAGPQWGSALLLALTGDLGVQHILDGALRDRPGREADAAIVAAYLHMARVIRALGLEGVWELPPPLNGNAVLQALPRLPRGPPFKAVMDEQVRWMLSHPEGSTEDATAHLVSVFGNYAAKAQ